MGNEGSDTLKRELSEIDQLLSKYENVTEIMANPNGSVWIEANGKVFDSKLKLTDERRSSIIRLMAGYNNQVCNYQNPTVGAKMPVFGGGRFQGIIPPVTGAPCFSIRIPGKQRFSIHDLEASGSIRPQHAEILEEAIEQHKNILIAGGTGSGKTTIVNALLQKIRHERLLVIEDNPELLPCSPNVVSMLTHENFSLQQAVHTTLRLRPDRIIVGEIRDGGTAIDLVKAWLTGHPGVLATIHADSAEGAKRRLRALMQEVVAVPPNDDIEAAIDVVVYVAKRYGDGRIRRVIDQVLVR